ncbi:MAG: methyl-accepting chemotaxis protein, partial [Planctomycetia bacterium]
MAAWIGRFAPRTIASRLLLCFLLISLLPVIVMGGLTFTLAALSLREYVGDHLLAIADAKTSRLNQYADDKLRSVTAQARNPTIAQAFEVLSTAAGKLPLDSPEYVKLTEKYRPYLRDYADAMEYANLLLVSPTGRILLTVEPSPLAGADLRSNELKGTELSNLIERTRTLLQADVSDFGLYPGSTEPTAFMAGPVFEDAKIVGVFAMQIDNEEIYGVINDYTGLGETGEAIIGTKVGDEVVFVAPSRFDPNAAFNRRARPGLKRSERIVEAASGSKGLGENIDYRGVTTVAAWTYLPAFRWGMVVKQDDAEAYALVYRLRNAFLVLFLLSVLPVVLAALVVARSISRPIAQAVRAAEQIADGDLTAQVAVHDGDRGDEETGRLLNAVAGMARNLNSLIGKVHLSSIQLLSAANQIGASSDRQESTIRDFGASTTQISAAVKEISATSEELAGTVKEVADVASQTAAVADVGRAGLEEMEESMVQLEDATRSITGKLTVISEKAAGITSVVTTITKVA